MQVFENNVDQSSQIYFHTPSPLAKELFLYPLCVGSYIYLPGYRLNRNNYHGFSIMYVKYGSCEFSCEKGSGTADVGSFTFIDGHLPHTYATNTGLTACWIDFNGPMAEKFYQIITSRKGNCIVPASTSNCEKLITTIYNTFSNQNEISEAILSKYLTDILTGLLAEEGHALSYEKRIQESIQYMNSHFEHQITTKELASEVCLSNYYYIKLFKKVTGCSPYNYLLHIRIEHAKYFLKTTQKSIKEIAFTCGFTTESSFGNAFRKIVGNSPARYRHGNP